VKVKPACPDGTAIQGFFLFLTPKLQKIAKHTCHVFSVKKPARLLRSGQAGSPFGLLSRFIHLFNFVNSKSL
jgi:hypothetical protein